MEKGKEWGKGKAVNKHKWTLTFQNYNNNALRGLKYTVNLNTCLQQWG